MAKPRSFVVGSSRYQNRLFSGRPSMSYLNRTIYMPWELLKAFSEHTGLFWSSIEIEGAICDAIALAMAPQSVQASAPALEGAAAQGYQWKQVFLPEGTVLRASFGRQPYYAVVEGCEIKYGEFSLSPSAFANLQGSGNRNAWKTVWLRFPGYKDWVRADECRAVRLAVTARLFEPGEACESDKAGAKPIAKAGPHQQQYTDNTPSRNNEIPLYQLLRDFPDKAGKAGSACTAPGPKPSGTGQPTHAAADFPRTGSKHNRYQHKAGKRKAVHRKTH
jgi:hypothetical protein